MNLSSLYFPICCLFFSIALNIVFFSKKRITSYETRLYKILIITNIISLIMEFFCTYFSYHNIPLISDIVLKSYLLILLLWVSSFTIYINNISKIYKIEDRDFNYIRKIWFYILFYIVTSIAIIISPIKYRITEYGANAYGQSVDIVYLASLIYALTWLVSLLKNIRNFKNKRYLPLYCYSALSLLIAYFQLLYPGILLITPIETFVTFIMYFTIENPDLKMINELNIAKGEAERANKAKTEFLANMSHEIRTPLNAITGFSQALSEEEGIPESAKEDINDIIAASNSLLEIVNGVLDISKIEANKIEIINKAYPPAEMFKELQSLTKVRIGEKPIELRTYIDSTIPKKLYGDHGRIKQIILNLLTNAAKYTEEGYIDFKVSSVIKDDVCRLIIAVEDTGKGIKKEQIDRLFNKFDRLDEEANITIEGTGLGLAITKRLLELMEGKITVQSVYGQGSKFTAYIDQKIVTDDKLEQDKEELEILTANEDNNKTNYADKKIIIVDDNKLNLRVAQKLLEKFNIQITTVQSGMECLEKITANEKYDLILMDDMMPKMNGRETLKKLKELPNFNIPTIVLTANALTGMRETYLNEGFDDYLAKPIEKIELEKILKTFLNEGKGG